MARRLQPSLKYRDRTTNVAVCCHPEGRTQVKTKEKVGGGADGAGHEGAKHKDHFGAPRATTAVRT